MRDAAQIYDRSHRLKTHAESIVWWQGFSSGADWMCLALEELRGHPLPKRTATFSWLGFVKYSLASLAPLAVLVLAWFVHPALVILVIPAFYAVEVQWVFLFPVVLDGSQNPWTDSRNLMQRHAGTLAAMSLVLPFAWRMLSGGLLGHGFVRSWCTGCLAVVLWYERCLNPVLATPKLDELPMLDIGQRGPLFIREETMSVAVDKSVRLLLITDIHAQAKNGEPLLTKIDAAVTMMSPDLIILGGDLADSLKGLSLLKKRMCTWVQTTPVLVIPGNHDLWLG
ncbi:MAG: metallophosphoesterase, partial [Prosthecobacter sp.]|nr:metallophosphoesterase [Prosthecobacter sp.]